ncbi:MAG TPA: SDR family NAD(P)-dependent oxidoreductase [Candidatus Binataceae bacterium]|nr:SDR family NAD(P)-dependent oxidoreductase [Candidatus Binataceae bacterium]
MKKADVRRRRDVVVVSGTLGVTARAAIRQFARDGALVGILGHGWESLEQARHEATIVGGESIALPVDVTNPGEVESASTVIERRLGPIDVWINDAVAGVFPELAEPDGFRRSTEASYLGVVHGTMAALKRMLPRNRGAIIQVAPSYADPPMYSGDYGAKRLISGFCDSMRPELMREGCSVRLTIVEVPLRFGSYPFADSAGWLGAPAYFAVIEAQAAAEAIQAAAGRDKSASDSSLSREGNVTRRPASSRQFGSGLH